jgi:hypothetical protein
MMTPSDSTWPLRMTADAAFGYRGEIPAARFEFPSPRVGVTIESRLLSSSKLSRVCRACRAASPSGRQHGILHFRPEQKLEFAHASRFRVLKTRLSVGRTGQLSSRVESNLETRLRDVTESGQRSFLLTFLPMYNSLAIYTTLYIQHQ